MAHERFEFNMPAPAAVVFDAFHYHCRRARWDPLVKNTQVVGGAPCPYIGAITENSGKGWMRALFMRTKFVSYDHPNVAAAAMMGRSFPFVRWAASMQHRPVDEQRSILVYTYTFQVGPQMLRWLLEPVVKKLFDRQTQRRFVQMRAFLADHADEIVRWQQLSNIG